MNCEREISIRPGWLALVHQGGCDAGESSQSLKPAVPSCALSTLAKLTPMPHMYDLGMAPHAQSIAKEQEELT